MTPHTVKRQPISCENCRNRKIKCTGGRAPCESCVRRGFGGSCYFVRSGGPLRDSALYDDLVDRIASLESLLRQHIAEDIACHRNTIPLTPTGVSSDASSSPNISAYAATDASLPPSSSFPLTGSLLKSPGGYVRFIPHTESFNSEDIAAFMQGESPSSPTSTAAFPFSVESTVSRQALLELLPSNRQCDELMQRFFTVFSPLFHVLHDPTLRTEYAEFCKSPGQVPLAFLALLFVVLAIAVLTLEIDDPLLQELSREGSGIARIRSIASRYRQAATKCLSADQFMLQHNLYTVKALVLLIYAMSHTDGPTWPLLGLTLHIATAIGCHIDPNHLGVGPVEAEERRRCWAGLKMLYQNQATCMGNLLPNPVSADVDLPADVNDDEINENGVHVPYHTRPPTQMTYILYKFRLYKVATDVCRATLDFLPLQSPLLRSLDARITQEQKELTRRFSNFQNLPLHHQANMQILKNYTNQLYLILHRPYLRNNNSIQQRAEAVDIELMKKSRRQCKTAAMAILDSHEELYETAGFRNYYWYVSRLGSFNAFLGASTLLTMLLDPQILPLSDEEYFFILAMVQRCSQRLEAMSERSEVCAKAFPILRRILGKAEQHARGRISADVVMPEILGSAVPFGVVREPNLVGSSITPPMDNPIPAVDLDGWTLHPELNAIMSHLPPEQWLAPSSFNWDRCWIPDVVQTSTVIPDSWS